MAEEEVIDLSFMEHWELYKDCMTISKISGISSKDALKSIQKYQDLPSHKRIQRVLHDHFNRAAETVEERTLLQEASLIQSVFPEISLYHILVMLTDFACEDNRIKIVMRKLLLITNVEEENQSGETSPPAKKAKIATADKPQTVTSDGMPSSSTDVRLNDTNSNPDANKDPPSVQASSEVNAAEIEPTNSTIILPVVPQATQSQVSQSDDLELSAEDFRRLGCDENSVGIIILSMKRQAPTDVRLNDTNSNPDANRDPPSVQASSEVNTAEIEPTNSTIILPAVPQATQSQVSRSDDAEPSVEPFRGMGSETSSFDISSLFVERQASTDVRLNDTNANKDPPSVQASSEVNTFKRNSPSPCMCSVCSRAKFGLIKPAIRLPAVPSAEPSVEPRRMGSGTSSVGISSLSMERQASTDVRLNNTNSNRGANKNPPSVQASSEVNASEQNSTIVLPTVPRATQSRVIQTDDIKPSVGPFGCMGSGTSSVGIISSSAMECDDVDRTLDSDVIDVTPSTASTNLANSTTMPPSATQGTPSHKATQTNHLCPWKTCELDMHVEANAQRPREVIIANNNIIFGLNPEPDSNAQINLPQTDPRREMKVNSQNPISCRPLSWHTPIPINNFQCSEQKLQSTSSGMSNVDSESFARFRRLEEASNSAQASWDNWGKSMLEDVYRNIIGIMGPSRREPCETIPVSSSTDSDDDVVVLETKPPKSSATDVGQFNQQVAPSEIGPDNYLIAIKTELLTSARMGVGDSNQTQAPSENQSNLNNLPLMDTSGICYGPDNYDFKQENSDDWKDFITSLKTELPDCPVGGFKQEGSDMDSKDNLIKHESLSEFDGTPCASEMDSYSDPGSSNTEASRHAVNDFKGFEQYAAFVNSHSTINLEDNQGSTRTEDPQSSTVGSKQVKRRIIYFSDSEDDSSVETGDRKNSMLVTKSFKQLTSVPTGSGAHSKGNYDLRSFQNSSRGEASSAVDENQGFAYRSKIQSPHDREEEENANASSPMDVNFETPERNQSQTNLNSDSFDPSVFPNRTVYSRFQLRPPPRDLNVGKETDFVRFISAVKRRGDETASTSKSRKTARIEPAKNDLQKELEDIFSPSITPERIKSIRKKHWPKKVQRPPPFIFEIIIAELLDDQADKDDSSSDSDDDSRNRMPSTSLPNKETQAPIKKYTVAEAYSVNLGPDMQKKLEQPINLTFNKNFIIKENGVPILHLPGEEERARDKNQGKVGTSGLDSIIDVDTDSSDEERNKEKSNSSSGENKSAASHLMEVFPDACPKYIHTLCQDRRASSDTLEHLISHMLGSEYPKREKHGNSPRHFTNVEEQFDFLKEVLTDADPNYLKDQCELFFEKPDEFKEFVAESLEKRDYPTVKETLRKQQLSAQMKQYTTEFDIEKFLEVIPDPVTYFNDPYRKISCVSVEGTHYAIFFLRNRFTKVQLQKIREVFRAKQSNLVKTCKLLKTVPSKFFMKSERQIAPMPETLQEIPLLQEIAFIQHEDDIIKFIEEKRTKEVLEREHAKQNGLMKYCPCCCNDEVMPKDIYTCQNGCAFCKDCVKKFAEVTFGEGKLNFECLDNCTYGFSLQTLQAVLNPKMFSIIALRKQMEEVKAAGLEDLETCPFCDFANIPTAGDKLFRCLNPECMKESCRTCRESSHVPLRCDEVEKEDEVLRRTYVENKMTEALLRKCYRCKMKFIKEDGCNKMTCSCGALMCYVCGNAVKDYRHFNGVGGDRFYLCPLYSDTNKLHEEAVLKGATEAKQEIGVDRDPSKLKSDPAVDVKEHYQEQARIHPDRDFLNVNPVIFLPPLNQRGLFQNLEQVMRQRRPHAPRRRRNGRLIVRRRRYRPDPFENMV